MKFGKTVIVLVSLGLAAVALAASEVRTKRVIVLVEDDGEAETRIELDSDDLGFDLQAMQEGENRSIVDENGRTVIITREADGFRFDVDGKTIRMPDIHGGYHGAVRIDGNTGEDVDVHVVRNMAMGPMHRPDGIMILSGKPIDAATQQQIRSLLESAGHDSEVHFVDRENHPHGPHRIKMIQKKAAATE